MSQPYPIGRAVSKPEQTLQQKEKVCVPARQKRVPYPGPVKDPPPPVIIDGEWEPLPE